MNQESLNNFYNSIPSDFEGYVLAQLTDRYIVDTWPRGKESLLDEEKILEIRIFNNDAEYKIFRSGTSKEFFVRTIDDRNELSNKDYFDEEQFLDIDTKKTAKTFSNNHEVVMTGGGTYNLPFESFNDVKVIIRYYFGRYEETGQAKIVDWRIVGFKKEEV